jgi:hypothetical protein
MKIKIERERNMNKLAITTIRYDKDNAVEPEVGICELFHKKHYAYFCSHYLPFPLPTSIDKTIVL